MHILRNTTCLLFGLTFLIMGCGSGGGTGPGENENETETIEYDLSVSMSPSSGGSVEPSSGTFEEGTEVIVEATANEGFAFGEWSDGISSEENPVAFTISEDTDITANFDDLRSVYTVAMVATNMEDTVGLRFGQSSRGTDGFDSGVDEDAPPSPPSGALHAFFEVDDLELFRDFRSNIDQQAEWLLQYQLGSDEDLKLEWEIVNDSKIEGSLVLTDEAGSFEVDMKSESSHTVSGTESGSLIISYQFN